MKFIKMHGLGNDYIYFDCLKNQNLITNPCELAKKICQRNFGIGADGIVLILPSDKADFKMRMFNADGSEAQMCGNAIRCVAKYINEANISTANKINIETLAGIKEISVIKNKDGLFDMAKVNMGKASIKNESIELNNGLIYQATIVDVGNPHCVIIVDKITDEHIFEHGKEIETHQLFPKRINVEFVEVVAKNKLSMRVWERGTGETLACGTGATATVAACITNGLTNNTVEVQLLGGKLNIEQYPSGELYMTGPATEVFRGEI